METNRTLEILRTYNFVERNHWQLMADLSDNDYDISYFGGRVTINDSLSQGGKYRLTEHHPPIITEDVFNAAQEENITMF